MSNSSSAKKTNSTVGNFVDKYTRQLKSAGISSAQLDVLVLLEDETGKDRGWLLAHPEYEIKSGKLANLKSKIQSRVKHEPIAYIRGVTEFYGRQFYVNKNVLEPRPESEIMITLLKDIRIKNPVIADVGTGSGALAITAKLEIPGSQVIATDIDSKCLKVAQNNATFHKVEIKFFRGNLLDPIPSSPALSVLLANLPYVPNNYKINTAAAMEPRLAIFGGSDGLDLYRKLFVQLAQLKQKPHLIFTESLPPQHEKLSIIAVNSGYELSRSDDLIQVFKKI